MSAPLGVGFQTQLCVNSPVSCSPRVPLFCESEELVQLCFLNHLISTLRPTPRWGRPLHLLAKRLGLQAGR